LSSKNVDSAESTTFITLNIQKYCYAFEICKEVIKVFLSSISLRLVKVVRNIQKDKSGNGSF
jgi:hypothetical protein